MKKAAIFLTGILALVLFGLASAQNQNVPTRVGFIDAEAVIRAHPGYAEVEKLQKAADAELAPLVEKLKAIEEKIAAGKATDKDREDYQTLLEAIKKVREKWTPKIEEKLNPLIKEVDEIVAKVANRLGFAVIMNRRVAAQSNLVVYAHPDTDITEEVIAELKKLKK